jgi:hypothetical protein
MGSVAIPNTRSLHIVARADGPAPSKRQQRFNSLIKRVAQLKRALQDWEHAQPGLHRLVGDHQRLAEDHTAALGALVRLLDGMYDERTLTKRERALLREILADLAGDVLRDGAGDDDVKAIYNRHSHGDFDAEAAEEAALQARMMKTILEHQFGMEFDPSVASLDDVQRAAKDQLDELDRQATEREADREARKAQRKKSARQLAAEARRTAETVQLGKTLQEVYRKLAMLLHPDHEQDPDERARKTTLMQEVNVAYEAKDLLKLLELRLRFEQVDEAAAHTIADDRLEHFNTLLAEQVRQLQHELSMVEEPWREDLELSRVTPARVHAHLQADLRVVRDALGQLRADVERLADPRELKLWLRAARRTAERATGDWPDAR